MLFRSFVMGALYSAIADVFSLSISYRGVVGKFKDKKLVSPLLRKDVVERLISKNPTTFLYDIAQLLSEIYNKPLVVDVLLNAHKGINPSNIQLSDFANGVMGLAKTLDKSGILKEMGYTLESFIQIIRQKYDENLKEQHKYKEKKADTPETQAAIEKIKKHADIGRDVVYNIIKEGGEVFKNKEGIIQTTRINKADVLPTVQWLEIGRAHV